VTVVFPDTVLNIEILIILNCTLKKKVKLDKLKYIKLRSNRHVYNSVPDRTNIYIFIHHIR